MTLYLFIYKLLLPKRYAAYLRRAEGNADKCHETLLHGTYYEEYDLYDFAHKGESARREYLTDAVRNRLCRRINNAHQQALVMDKFRTADCFAHLYGRHFMKCDRHTPHHTFIDFFTQHGQVVVKPVDDCGGRGVRLIASIQEAQDFWANLQRGRQRFIVEERLMQHPALAQFNPDSINTIRINTILRKGKVTLFTSFIRTGRQGCFVDNGAQGGLFASIDTASGRIFTPAFDEHGHRFDLHPDSAVAFQGQQIPDWSRLCQLAIDAAKKLSKMTYVGWDFALTPQGWKLVEANKGEFIAQQITQGRGLRREFERLVME